MFFIADRVRGYLPEPPSTEKPIGLLLRCVEKKIFDSTLGASEYPKMEEAGGEVEGQSILRSVIAEESTRSQSGWTLLPAGLDIVHPEVVPLGIEIVEVSATDAFDPVQQGRIGANGPAQVGPVRPSSARSQVVNGRERIALVVK